MGPKKAGAGGLPTPSRATPSPATPSRSMPEPQGLFTKTPKRGALNTPGTTPSKPSNKPKGGGGIDKTKRLGTKSRSRSRALRAPRRDRDPELTAQLQAEDIEVLQPGDLEYERSVASSNLLYRFSRPTYVVRPHNTGQVQTIVQEAVARKVPLTIKNGGHSYIGSSFPNDGIMLDLKYMNKVDFDRYVHCFSCLSHPRSLVRNKWTCYQIHGWLCLSF